MNQVYKNLALWMVIGLIVILLFTVFQGAQQGGQEQPNFSEFLKAVDQGRVDSVVIRGNHVTYSLKDSAQTLRTYIVEYPDLIKTLKDRGVRIAVKPPDANPWYAIFLQWVPMLLFIGACIIFMDEIDAVGRHRGAGLGGGHDEREQTLNQLLVEMDGFETNEGVILIAATNRPDVLDPALLRPGRFDRQVVVPRPDVKGREEILRVHARRIPLAPNVDLKVLARGTPGFSGADLANLVNEAALLAARQNKKLVEMVDFENAKDKVLMGVERRSMIISDAEKRTIAYHEAGHTLVADFLPGTDPVHKVTIIPRGRALGLTQQLPLDDKYNYSKDYLVNRITILLGGRAAEEIVLHQQTTGAGDDLEKATEMARKMVCEWGMSEKLGPLTFGKNEEHLFLGREVARAKDYSEDTALMSGHAIPRPLDRALPRHRDQRGGRTRPPRLGGRAARPQGPRADLRGHRARGVRPCRARGRRARDQRRLRPPRPRRRRARRQAPRERHPHVLAGSRWLRGGRGGIVEIRSRRLECGRHGPVVEPSRDGSGARRPRDRATPPRPPG